MTIMLYVVGVAAALGSIFICTIEDWRQKNISVICTAIFLAANMLLAYCQKHEIAFMLTGFMVGVLFFLISLGTGEKIGKGDALFIMGIGVCFGFYQTLGVVFLALLMSSIYGVWMYFVKKSRSWSCEIAFIPFLWIPYTILLFLQIVR